MSSETMDVWFARVEKMICLMRGFFLSQYSIPNS